MKVSKGQGAVGAAGGGGAAGIINQWDSINSIDFTLLPLAFLLTYLAIFGLLYLILDLRKRLKALEAK